MSARLMLVYVLCITLHSSSGTPAKFLPLRGPSIRQPHAAATNETTSLRVSLLIESQQTEQQTNKERKESEKRAKEEERQREKEEELAKQKSKERPTFTPLTEIPDGKALIYIYKAKVYGKEVYTVQANGEAITKLEKGGYYPYLASPGEVGFSAKGRSAPILPIFILFDSLGHVQNKSTATLSVEAGKVYYLKMKSGLSVGLVQVPEDVAMKELAKCKLLPKYSP
jgi:hypothetical protein